MVRFKKPLEPRPRGAGAGVSRTLPAYRAWIAAGCLLALGGACKKAAPVQVEPPRLVVLVVVDQLRGDEIAAYGALWHYGFRRLRDEGRWYTRAFHTHGRTETAAGHAVLGTGELPMYSGVVDKTMYFPERQQVFGVCDLGQDPCTPDALRVPTLGDRLKTALPGARVVALAEKARSASLLGGKLADQVVWHDEKQIGLVGRTAGKPGLPSWLNLFYTRVAAPDRIARIWELPRFPEPFASRPDPADGKAGCGHGDSFPHRLTATEGANLVAQWHCTPDSDRAVVETALQLMRHLELGKDATPDLLLVSLSAVDIVGHAFGYESRERMAVLTELDRQLGDLLDGLRAWVGPHLLVALSADHGVAPRVATARAMGQQSGRVASKDMQARAEAALADLGPGPHIAAMTYPFIHLVDMPAAVRAKAAARVAQALRTMPEMYKAWTQTELASDPDPIAGLMRANAYPGRSGDVILALKPYFAPGDNEMGATHGLPWDYDRQVPVLLWGEGVAAGRVDQEVAVVDMVRTLGDRLGLPADPNGGKPLP